LVHRAGPLIKQRTVRFGNGSATRSSMDGSLRLSLADEGKKRFPCPTMSRSVVLNQRLAMACLRPDHVAEVAGGRARACNLLGRLCNSRQIIGAGSDDRAGKLQDVGGRMA
jgi:hypothetical protein